MKNLKAVACLLLLVLVIATFSFSEENKGTLRIPVGLGIQFPFGDWSSLYDIGFNLNAGVIYPINKKIEIQAGLGFFYNSAEEQDGPYTYKSKLTNLSLALDGRYNLNLENLKCFLTGGLGLYLGHVKFTEETYGDIGTSNETNLGVRLGGGVSITRNLEAIALVHIIPDMNMVSLGLSYKY